MIDLEARVSAAELERLRAALNLSEEACRRAARRAVRKTAQWTMGATARSMSQTLRIEQKMIRARLRTYLRGEGLEQKVWLGLNRLVARRLGTPTRQGSGTRVGRHFFEGAFPIRRYGYGVYRRTTEDRFPLELAKLEIDQAGERALREAGRRAEQRLLQVMQQEMNYELQKLIGRDK